MLSPFQVEVLRALEFVSRTWGRAPWHCVSMIVESRRELTGDRRRLPNVAVTLRALAARGMSRSGVCYECPCGRQHGIDWEITDAGLTWLAGGEVLGLIPKGDTRA